MSTLYLIALCAFAAVMAGILFDAVASVGRKPSWHAHRSALAEAPADVQAVAGPLATPVLAGAPFHPIVVGQVEERHSGFVGLTNNEEFQLTA
ncbi:MAG: hypothetical protein ABIO71_08680 [Caldimonas sp.]